MNLPHISKGYRVGFDSPRHVLVSLFTLHNETVNIWSHLLGAGYVLYRLFEHTGGRAVAHELDATEHQALLVFLLSALACLTLSSCYHWWGCGSQRLFELLLRADFVGIAALIWGSYVPGIHYAFFCFPHLQTAYQAVIVAVAALGIVGAAFTDVNCPKQSSFRTTTFALLVGFGLVPAVHWCWLVPAHVRWMFLDNLAAMFLRCVSPSFGGKREGGRALDGQMMLLSLLTDQTYPRRPTTHNIARTATASGSRFGPRASPRCVSIDHEPRLPSFSYFSPVPNHNSQPQTRNKQAVIPGRFDLALSSHNLWHLCILVAIVFWHQGLLEYSEALHTLGCHYLDEPPPPLPPSK